MLVSVKFHKQFTVTSLLWKFGIDLHLEYFTEVHGENFTTTMSSVWDAKLKTKLQSVWDVTMRCNVWDVIMLSVRWGVVVCQATLIRPLSIKYKIQRDFPSSRILVNGKYTK